MLFAAPVGVLSGTADDGPAVGEGVVAPLLVHPEATSAAVTKTAAPTMP
jgi:hypothetical protein